MPNRLLDRNARERKHTRTDFSKGLAAAAVACISTIATADFLHYDPSLGTMPQAQGWTFVGSYNAPATVTGGQLTYGPTTVGGTTYWAHDPVTPISFATQTVFIEATIRLTGADFGNFSGFRRAGFTLYLRDDAGRWIVADMGDNRISIGNDDNRTSDPAMVFDLTSDFHTARLEAGPAGGRLLVDGNQMLTLALGSGVSGGATGRWGEGTTLANANLTEVRGATYIPAPAAACVAFFAACAAGRRRR